MFLWYIVMSCELVYIITQFGVFLIRAFDFIVTRKWSIILYLQLRIETGDGV